jgi:hypothetical protein
MEGRNECKALTVGKIEGRHPLPQKKEGGKKKERKKGSNKTR